MRPPLRSSMCSLVASSPRLNSVVIAASGKVTVVPLFTQPCQYASVCASRSLTLPSWNQSMTGATCEA